MEVLYPCCGLDVQRRTVVACLVRPGADGQRRKETRTFGTTTAELTELRDWLSAAGCPAAAMESTGVYWKPVFNILDGRVAVRVVNAQHVRAVPGRKTDVKDAEWLADLLQHGLLKASFVPGRAQRELRDLTRTRTTLVDERSSAVKRVQKVLEDANVKLAGVATDVMGVSGRAMLAAIVAGATDAAALAELAKGKLRNKREQLERALSGRVEPHHRFMLATHLSHVDFLDEAIAWLSAEIAERLRAVEAELDRLATIPGVGRRTAEVFAAEVGLEMGQVPSARHLAAWAGMAPGNHESGGRRLRGATRPGNKRLRRALVEAATAAARNKGSHLAARYRRLAVRCGRPKARVAVGHAILVTAYHLLDRRTVYRQLDSAALDERRRDRVRQRALSQLATLGYAVTLHARDGTAA